jgi:hypothetical protein
MIHPPVPKQNHWWNFSKGRHILLIVETRVERPSRCDEDTSVRNTTRKLPAWKNLYLATQVLL